MSPRRLVISITILLLLSFCSNVLAAQSAGPSKQPILRVETGMHTTTIKRIGVDAAGRYLVTCSDDRTARVWDLTEGNLMQVLRPPIGRGNEGKLYAVAMSPDGETIAAAGYTTGGDKTFSIYLFDRSNGRLRQRISNISAAVFNLAFSKDGRFLVSCHYAQNGIRIFQMPSGTQVAEDTNYGDDIYGADFDKNGRLATASYDGFVRLYDANFRLVAKKKAPGGIKPYSLAFSPDGQKIAVVFDDSTKISVLSGQDLSSLYAPNTQGLSGRSLFAVAWSADGNRLYAGGRVEENGSYPMYNWLNAGQGSKSSMPAGYNSILHAQAIPDGGVVYGAADPTWGALTPDGTRRVFQQSAIPDLRGNREGFLLSPDGATVKFSYKYGGKAPASFSITKRELEINPPEENGLTPPKTSAQGLDITDWKNNEKPKLSGRLLALDAHEESRSLAIAPDGKNFLLGTEWSLRFFDRTGKEKWSISTPSVAWAVNIARNGKVAAAAYGDGTIRWYSITDGKELMAFFPHSDQKRWVLWTPTGYYDASPGGEDLIGWHLNREKNQEADFFPASRFRAAKYRPEVVAKILTAMSETEAVRLADTETGRKQREVELEKILPPVIRILSPKDGTQVSETEVKIKFELRSPGGEPITGVKVLIDGRPATKESDTSASKDRGMVRNKASLTPGEQEISVTIPQNSVEVGLIAENRHASSQPAVVKLMWKGATQPRGEFVIKPKLYVLAIGVSDYKDSELALKYAAKDAKDFADTLSKQKDTLYREVVVNLLTDAKATKDAVLDGLEWIERQTTSKDVAMIFLAGHGVNDDTGNYYFLPSNVDLNSLRRSGLPFTEIQRTVSGLAGKTLFFVDTCHAGNIMGKRRGTTDINAMINELASAENGAVVFASSTGKQYSLEDPAWENGAFTKALVEGLMGKADFRGQGKITINMIDLYISDRVKELTKGRQTPTTTKPQTIPDFPVAVVKTGK